MISSKIHRDESEMCRDQSSGRVFSPLVFSIKSISASQSLNLHKYNYSKINDVINNDHQQTSHSEHGNFCKNP